MDRITDLREKDERGSLEKRLVRAAIAAFLLLTTILIACFPFPPLLDFPNHYARMWLLAGGIDQAPFPAIYEVDWHRAVTNVGIDLMARWIGPVLGVSLLAHCLLFLAITLPPLGAIALNSSLFGRAHLWQIAILFLAWCATLIGGFINFQIGLGLALLLAALDHRLAARKPAVVFMVRVLAAFLLTIVHIFATGFYLALLWGLAFGSTMEPWRQRTARLAALRRIGMATLAVVLPVLLIAAQGQPTPDANQGMAMWNANPVLIALNLLTMISTYIPVVDVLFAIPIILIVTRALKARQYRIHAGLCLATLGLLLLATLSPRHIMATGWISWRFPIMAALTGMAMLLPWPLLAPRRTLLLAMIVCIAVFGRSGWIGYNWWRGNKDAQAVLTVLSHVPPGAAILPLTHIPDNRPLEFPSRYYAWNEDTFRHLATLAVPFSNAFVPTIFTAKGKQPLAVKDPWSRIAVPEGSLMTSAVLTCPHLLQEALIEVPYLRHWQQDFDYVLILNTDIADVFGGNAVPQALKPVAQTDFAQLYVIDKKAERGAAAIGHCRAHLFEEQ
ncbi:hypothetical protein [Rhizobium paknamense]|uniref:Uncharacterized protein n=1 Tax=Rhizobium paknamense TaxID=1206817 RepID=A0ABU0IGJ8_9HYPH|nr:hypothetical protein [Rhizobium paknamense]MDQ0456366.1 hypothetical protein [Rhizobium paknamense]